MNRIDLDALWDRYSAGYPVSEALRVAIKELRLARACVDATEAFVEYPYAIGIGKAAEFRDLIGKVLSAYRKHVTKEK